MDKKNHKKLIECIKKEIAKGATNTGHAIMIQMLEDSLEDNDFDNPACDAVAERYGLNPGD